MNVWTLLRQRRNVGHTELSSRTLRDTRELREPETGRDMDLRLEACRRQLKNGYVLPALRPEDCLGLKAGGEHG